MRPEDVSPWVVMIGAVVAALVVIVAALVKAWPTIRRTVETIESLSHLPEWMRSTDKWMAGTDGRLDRMTGTLGDVKHEVLPNNGGSLRDEVDRQSTKLDAVVEWQEKHEAKSDLVVARVDKLEVGGKHE